MKLSTILRQNITGKLFNHVLVFLINVIIVRMLGAERSGGFFNELYVINFFAFIFSAGLDYSAIAWISSQPNLVKVVHERLFTACAIFIAFSMSMVWFLMPEYKIISIQSPLGIIFFAAGNIMLILFQGVLSALKKFNLQNILLITTNTCFFVIVVIRF